MYFFDKQANTVTAWLQIHPLYSLNLWISIYFGLYEILLMENFSIPWNTVKGTWY